MALLLHGAVFVHTPKTGGQWVAAALRHAKLVTQEIRPVHATPAEILGNQCVVADVPLFCFVRHPVKWYRSMWTHRIDEEWEPIDDLEWFSPESIELWSDFTKCRADSLIEFVENCAEKFPDGFVSRLFELYSDRCAIIGKQESIVDDLVAILHNCGEDFSPETIRSTPPRNVRGSQSWRSNIAQLDSETITLIERIERRAIARFGYDSALVR